MTDKKTEKTGTEKESSTYQGMLKEVETIIHSISSDELELDSMVEKVEKGYQLIKTMRDRLDIAKEKIETLQMSFTDSAKNDEGEA